MSSIKFHTNFTLNGKSFKSVRELLDFASTISNDIFAFLTCWFEDDDFIIVKTSGSTGTPTNIQLKKEYMVNSAMATGNYFELAENTKALLCLSPAYIAGKMMLVRAMMLGWHLDVVETSSHPLEDTERTYDFCAMVPLQLSNSLSKLDQIKKLIVGGAAVSNELIEKLQDISTRVYATYGMTETITHIAIKPLNNFDNVISNECEKSIFSRTEFYYNILPNVKISKDVRDCLIIDAPKVSDKQIITNDVVKLISDTEFEWLGRYDTIINSGGVKLIPEQIEKKLAAVIDKRFFVAGIPDELLGEKMVLIIEDEKSDNVISNKVKNLNTLDKFEVPKEIFFIKKFVETDTKKIQRQKTLDLIFKN